MHMRVATIVFLFRINLFIEIAEDRTSKSYVLRQNDRMHDDVTFVLHSSFCIKARSTTARQSVLLLF